MAFRFFRPWEDDWTSAPKHGASAEHSATTNPPQVESSPILQKDEPHSSPGKARKTPLTESDVHEALSGMQKTTVAVTTSVKSLKLKLSLVETLSSTTSLSVQRLTVPLAKLVRPAQAVNAVNKDAQQDNSVGQVSYTDESTACVTSPSPSNKRIAYIKNGLEEDAVDKSSDGSKKLSTLDEEKTFRQSLRLLQNEERKNESRSGRGEHHKQILLSSHDFPSQEQLQSTGKWFKCEVCEKAFSCLSMLQRHERVHSGSKPFKCTDCEKAFSQSGVLQRHKRTHTGSKPFKCGFCEKAFARLSALHEHERIHTGSKPSKCEFCGKAFTQSSQLRTHERIHTGSKPYKCKCCGQAFTQSSTLQAHEQTHTGSRPFKCTFCEKAFFTSSGNLHKHRGVHTSS